MATMIPDSVQQFTTEGERQTYRFIETVAKPDNKFLCWYLPDIQGREPDFLLFSGTAGLVILEVKDWNLEQIREATPYQFVIDIGRKSEPRPKPFRQGRDYVSSMMDTVKADGRLISKDPFHHGNPKIPMSCGVVFPNINKYEYVRKGFDQIIETNKIFFWDDLHPASDICSDLTGACFSKVLEERFPPRFAFTLTGPEMDHLKQLIFPVVRIEIPERKCDFPYEKRVCRFKGLDHHQEVLARKFDGGHRIITGPSGSGKTLILVHKASFLLKYNPGIKNILFVCFNITLVNYIARLLADKGIPLGENGVSVFHFYQLCSKIIGEDIAYENENSAYYELVEEETLSKVQDVKTKYDAVLVDEGQDFSDNMFQIIIALLNRQTNNLTIALDENQDIYRRHSSWSDIGVQARGRVHRISNVYRSTKELTEFASKFIGEESTSKVEPTKQLELFPDFFDFHGPKPVFEKFPDIDALTSYVSEKVSEIVGAEKCPYSEIGILYIKKSLRDESTRFLPVKFETALNSKGILCNWLSQNYQSKKSYDITTNRVAISTIHSAKGFDFAHVFLIGLDMLEENGWTGDQIDHLVYVAITRARYQLFIPYVHKTPLIEKLEACI